MKLNSDHLIISHVAFLESRESVLRPMPRGCFPGVDQTGVRENRSWKFNTDWGRRAKNSSSISASLSKDMLCTLASSCPQQSQELKKIKFSLNFYGVKILNLSIGAVSLTFLQPYTAFDTRGAAFIHPTAKVVNLTI